MIILENFQIYSLSSFSRPDLLQTSLQDYQGTKRIIAERESGTLAQHQDRHPLDSPPIRTEV